MRANNFLLLWIIGFVGIGCEPSYHRAETRLLPDGTIERAILQPLEVTPCAVQHSADWETSYQIFKSDAGDVSSRRLNKLLLRYQAMAARDDQEFLHAVPRIQYAAFPHGIYDVDLPFDFFADEPPSRQQEWPSADYYLARGKFADLRQIPAHLEFVAPKQLPSGKLVRQLDRKDLGLVTEWTWEETLTDCVTISDHRAARNEVLELVVPVVVAACREVWGPDYQLQDLEQWLRGEVTTCFHDVCDAVLDVGLRKEYKEYTDARVQLRIAGVLKRHGLDQFDDEGQVIQDQAELDRRLRAFLTVHLQKYVRDKQGRPISNQQVEELLHKGEVISTDESTVEESRFNQVLNRLLVAKFGSEEQATEYAQRISARLFGLYLIRIFQGEREFNYEMTVPGVVLETNAQLETDQTVRWKFNAKEAYPLGYTMRLVVAVPNQVVLDKHFPNAKLNRREALIAYRNLVPEKSDLLAELQDLVRRDDSAAWKDWCSKNSIRQKLLELLQP